MNVKRILVISIVVFWCLMNILLLRRQLWAPTRPIQLHTVSAITEPLDESWGIYYRGEKIGYSAQTITPTGNGFLLKSSSVMHLGLLGTVQTIHTRLEMDAGPDWTLEAFDFDLESKGIEFKARGKVVPGKLQLEVRTGGHQDKREIPLRQPPYLPAALRPYVATQNLEPGKQHLFLTLDPSTLSQQVTAVTVEGRELISVGGKLEPAIRIRQRFKGLSVLAWVDGEGKTLKEESPGGFSLVRVRPEELKSFAESPRVSLDLITQTSVPVETPIIDPDQKNFLKVKLSGFNLTQYNLNTGRQRLTKDVLEISQEDVSQARSYRIPIQGTRFASYLQPTPFLQSDHPRIRALTQEILRGETDAIRATKRIQKWVYSELSKEPTVSIPSALEVLETKKGDCNEHTVLFNAVARAAGIPAKTVIGVVYLRGAFYYHAWSEVWLGQWVSVDSVLNQFPANVTHIKFLEGEIDQQLDILQLIGNLEIKLLEVS